MTHSDGRTPLVTVVTGVYNGGAFLHAAIDSILQQTFTDFEFILVDDASTDNTPAILAAWARRDARIVLVSNATNLGLTRTLNKGVRLARGRWIARQDADDISLPRRLEKQVQFLNSHPEVGLLGTLAWGMDAQGGLESVPRLVPYDHASICWRMLLDNPFFHSSVMVARDLVLACPYDEKLRFAQDFDLWGRLLTRTRGANLPEPLICLRRHGRCVSAVHAQAQQEIRLGIVRRRCQALVPDWPGAEQEVERVRAVMVSDWPVAGETGSACRLLLRLFAAFVEGSDLDRTQLTGLRGSLFVRLWESVLHALTVGAGGRLVWEMVRQDAGMTGRALGQVVRCVVLKWLQRGRSR